MNVIHISGVSRKYGELLAAHNISLKVNKGEIYGFIGLNGAGKTTLIRIMLGMIKPDRGNVFLFGDHVASHFKHWNKVGYLVETPKGYPNLTVNDNLRHYFYLRDLKDRDLIEEVIDRLGLTNFRHTPAKHLSLGNKQRLGLARALMHKPELLILDEPINGLDPAGVVEVRNLLRQMAHSGTTIFLSSHNLAEVWKVVDKVGIIHKGILLQEKSKEDIKKTLDQYLELHSKDLPSSFRILREHGYKVQTEEGNCLKVWGREGVSSPEAIIELLVRSGLPPAQVILKEVELEDYFINTITKDLVEED